MILIFDYFETLLNNKSMDFNRGLKPFWEKYYKDRCQFEDIKEYGEELFEHLLSMHAKGLEFPFVKEELPLYAKKYGGDVVEMSTEEEADFLMLCNEFELDLGVKRFLEECYQKNTPMYVLSNSGFTAEALMIVLNRFGIGKYFKKLWSSADFGKIKPCKDFFDIAIQKALEDNPSESKEDIIYIGDTYASDVVGAHNARFKVAWLNKKGEEDSDNLATYVVNKMDEISF